LKSIRGTLFFSSSVSCARKGEKHGGEFCGERSEKEVAEYIVELDMKRQSSDSTARTHSLQLPPLAPTLLNHAIPRHDLLAQTASSESYVYFASATFFYSSKLNNTSSSFVNTGPLNGLDIGCDDHRCAPPGPWPLVFLAMEAGFVDPPIAPPVPLAAAAEYDKRENIVVSPPTSPRSPADGVAEVPGAPGAGAATLELAFSNPGPPLVGGVPVPEIPDFKSEPAGTGCNC
jgi:hypothetical protein